jgi:O-antigen/teichoic acid export membrane protein
MEPDSSTPSASGHALAQSGVATSRRIGAKAIRRGLAVNVAGTLVPALFAIFCIRDIVRGLGHTRFGVLSLAWTFINAVGILDLGIGRALTRFLAVHEERDSVREAAVVWTSLASMLVLGVFGGVLAWAGAGPIAARLAHGDAAVQRETASALRILSLSVPLVVLSSGLRGILEAFGRFDRTNSVSVPISILNLVIPVALLRFEASLPTIVSALVALRLLGTLLFLRSALTIVPPMRLRSVSLEGMRSVLAFAGWVTVSNITGPLFAQAERFFVGSFRGLAAVGYYSTPADLLTRITIVPSAVLQVMFPVLAQAMAVDRQRAARLSERVLVLITAAVLPAVTLLVAIAPEGVHLWLGPEFAAHATRPARIVAVALFINCLAWLPFSLVQSAGRAEWTGKLHAVEMPVHIALTAALVSVAGAEGAAIAMLVRATMDGAVITSMASRVLGDGARLGRNCVVFLVLGLVTIGGAAAPVPLPVRLAWSSVSLLAVGVATWRVLLDELDRHALMAELAGAWARIRGAVS